LEFVKCIPLLFFNEEALSPRILLVCNLLLRPLIKSNLHMSRFALLFIIVICYTSSLKAQGYQLIFPASTGQALLDSLFDHYRPGTVLDYTQARDTLYAKVLAVDDDTLRCIYSGHALYLDPTQDPTQYVYLNGSSLGMNTEHAYPQSKGAADGNARSDMHHLYPARIPVNEARGDVPYLDIVDAQTQKWFLGAQVFLSMPAQNKDLYAEFKTGAFEPRESVKGDLARAIFYFYTMYRSQANIADPNFFELQRPTLCQWAVQDPADAAELLKTWRIAPYQEGKPNPYVVDCTLAHRSWCPEIAANCVLSAGEPFVKKNLGLRVSPHPAVAQSRMEMTLPFGGNVRGRILSLQGQELAVFQSDPAPAGAFVLPLDLTRLAGLGGWVGFLEVELTGAEGHVVQGMPLVIF
jgi:Endonuclease I